jgi:GMP synthase-like glutamine amidotransferase
MLNICDLGNTFGMSGGEVFLPWQRVNAATINSPRNLEEFANTAKDVDLVIFGGGGDIHPAMYGQIVRGAYVGPNPSFRDINEAAAYAICKQYKIPVLGICRGAQLACIQAGGELIQHVSGHGRGHDIVDVLTKKVYRMSSLHHQMMYAVKTKHQVIATVINNISTDYSGFVRIPENFMEPEIIFFPAIQSLAVQGHPEMLDPNSETVKYVRGLVNQHLLKGTGPNV